MADGIHRIGRAHTNCYLVQDGRHLTLVDAGLPSMWEQTMRVIAGLGHAPEDVRALLLTHAHFDHIGFAARAQRTLRIPVWVHEMDAFLADPYRYKPERNRFLYPLRYPRSVPILLGMTRAGALNVALPGHGEPWNDGIARAVEIARRQGIR
ncbi:MAG: MBL fold metallo-hydrolase [Nocardioidaceae bacterium]